MSSTRPETDQYVLNANWGNISLLLLSLPAVSFALLNPISLFIAGSMLFWGVVLSFIPKLVYFLLLEFAIAQGRGSDFYHTHHSRRMGMEATLSLGYLESLVVRAASMFGGVEVAGRKLVAQARKKYAERPLGVLEMGQRILSLPGHVWPSAKNHVANFFRIVWHMTIRWLALNVIARLYTKQARIKATQGDLPRT